MNKNSSLLPLDKTTRTVSSLEVCPCCSSSSTADQITTKGSSLSLFLMCWCRSLGPELPVLLYISLCDDDDTRQDCYYITINALSPRIIYIYQRCLCFKCPMRKSKKERSSKKIQSLIARKRQSRQRISAKSMRFPFLRQSFNPCGTFWALFSSFLITSHHQPTS